MEPPAPVTETLVAFGDRTRRELEAVGHKFRTKEEIDAFLKEATAGDYDALLRTCLEWVSCD